MTDTAQLREALKWERGAVINPDVLVDPPLWILAEAAKELLALREAGALIIVPDENGKWPGWAGGLTFGWDDIPGDEILDALRDAMPPEDAK